MAASDAELDAFVKTVAGWTTSLRACAHAAVEQAHTDFIAGDVDLVAYNAALQNELATVQACLEINNAASTVLLTVAESALAPLADATTKLGTAVKNIQHVEAGVAVAGQVLSVAVALAACFAAPTAASIVAVAAGVGALAKEVAGAAKGAGDGGKPAG